MYSVICLTSILFCGVRKCISEGSGTWCWHGPGQTVVTLWYHLLGILLLKTFISCQQKKNANDSLYIVMCWHIKPQCNKISIICCTDCLCSFVQHHHEVLLCCTPRRTVCLLLSTEQWGKWLSHCHQLAALYNLCFNVDQKKQIFFSVLLRINVIHKWTLGIDWGNQYWHLSWSTEFNTDHDSRCPLIFGCALSEINKMEIDTSRESCICIQSDFFFYTVCGLLWV